MNKKSQSAIEFMIIVAAVLFLYLMILYALQVNTADQTRSNVVVAVKEVALTIQSEVRLANSASDGYRRTFYLPVNLLNGIGYDARITIHSIYINTSSEGFALAIGNVTGQPIKGDNIIRKTNNSVYLNS